MSQVSEWRLHQYSDGAWMIERLYHPGEKAKNKAASWVTVAYTGDLGSTAKILTEKARRVNHHEVQAQAASLDRLYGEAYDLVLSCLVSYLEDDELPKFWELSNLDPAIQFEPMTVITWQMSKRFSTKNDQPRWQAVKWVTLPGMAAHIIAYEMGQGAVALGTAAHRLQSIKDRFDVIPSYISAYVQRKES